MLEILSHQYLKKFMRSKKIDWSHIYSFGRIISKCIQSNSTYLINSEIFQLWIGRLDFDSFIFERRRFNFSFI